LPFPAAGMIGPFGPSADLRDPYQRPDVVNEFWRALCLYTVRESGLVVSHRRSYGSICPPSGVYATSVIGTGNENRWARVSDIEHFPSEYCRGSSSP
jgi:hypothetical protein